MKTYNDLRNKRICVFVIFVLGAILIHFPLPMKFQSFADLSATNVDFNNDDALVWINETASCRFQTGEDASIPLILMSLGRSGSSITWMTISRLIGEESIAFEYTGGNKDTSNSFFNSIPSNVGRLWASFRLCEVQNELSVRSISGFQWKPYVSIRSRYALEALREIALRENPSIRVIYLLRNPLDRQISNIKHAISKSLAGKEHKIPPHCAVDDDECRKAHLSMATDLVMPTGEELLKHLNKATRGDEQVGKLLKMIGVKHITVHYEKLYNSDFADEWMKIFRFLGRGPAEGLTMEEVRKHFSIGRTDKSRKEMVKNWPEVQETLKGTKYQWMAEPKPINML